MPAPTLHHPRTQINPSEEDELRRLEGAPPPSIDLTEDGPPEPAMSCPCGLGQCTLITAKTERNMGRQFFKCPVRDGGCNFFKWCDEAPPAGAPRAPNNSAPAYGGGGGYANGQANGFGGNAASDAEAAEPAMACPCGLGQCSVLSAKTERNMGRKVRTTLPCLAGACVIPHELEHVGHAPALPRGPCRTTPAAPRPPHHARRTTPAAPRLPHHACCTTPAAPCAVLQVSHGPRRWLQFLQVV